jgi:two-component system response regulator NreC
MDGDETDGPAGSDAGSPEIGIFLLEDHVVVREGLRMLLDGQKDMTTIGEAASLEELERVGPLLAGPDVVLADMVLPDGRAADVVAAVRQRFPDAEILALTMLDGPADVRQILTAGARGYMLKEAATTDLVAAVRRVARGEDYLHPSLGAAIVRRVSPSPTDAEPTVLSPKERTVLQLLALGHTNAEIAEAMSVSLRTVETHRARILDKLKLRTRADLVRYAATSGLVQISAS